MVLAAAALVVARLIGLAHVLGPLVGRCSMIWIGSISIRPLSPSTEWTLSSWTRRFPVRGTGRISSVIDVEDALAGHRICGVGQVVTLKAERTWPTPRYVIRSRRESGPGVA